MLIPENNIQCYKSNILLLLYNYIWTLLYAIGVSCILLFVLNYFFPLANSVFYITIIVVVILCLLYSIWGAYAKITITNDDVIIKKLFAEQYHFSRKQFSFTSHVSVHSINFIPVQKYRYLLVYNEIEQLDFLLPNISKKQFDKLIASLIKVEPYEVSELLKIESKKFIVPKEAMLKDYAKLIKIYSIVSFIFSAGIIGFVFYKSMYGSFETQRMMHENKTVLLSIVFCLLMFQFPIIILFAEYQKRKQKTPDVVTIKNDCLMFGKKQYPANEIQQIIITPPIYGQGSSVKYRKITLQTKNGKFIYRFGVPCSGGQFESVVFTDYFDMCEKMEKYASTKGIQFIRDL